MTEKQKKLTPVVEESVIKDFFEENKKLLVNYDVFSLSLIYKALEEGLDVKFLLKPKMSYEQLLEIYYGLKYDLDVEVYAHHHYSCLFMKELRHMLRNGAELSFLKTEPKEEHARLIIKILEENNDYFLLMYPMGDYSLKRYELGYNLYKENLNYQLLMNSEKVSDLNVELVYRCLIFGLPVEDILDECYSQYQRKELFLGVLEGLDISKYKDPLFTSTQMRQIRLGLAFGVDVDYNDIHLSPEDMKIRLREVMNNNYKEHEFNFKFIEKLADRTPVKFG